jgi:hypothetical protein
MAHCIEHEKYLYAQQQVLGLIQFWTVCQH